MDPSGKARGKPAVDLEQPVFVCGVGRSGTSLVQSMLHAHPDLSFPAESHFFRRYVAPRTPRKLGLGDWHDLLAADAELAWTDVSVDELLAGEGDGEVDPQRIYRRLLKAVAERHGTTRVGDKDPRFVEVVPALHGRFPQAYLIQIVRDPRDVLLSRTRAAWARSRPWIAHVMICREQLIRGSTDGPAYFGDRYLQVQYEQLIDDPEPVLRELCQGLDLPYDPAMLSFGGPARELVTEVESSWKQETLGPLLTHNSGKWRNGLSRIQVLVTEALCLGVVPGADYRRSNPGRDGMLGVLVFVSASLLRIAARVGFRLRALLSRV